MDRTSWPFLNAPFVDAALSEMHTKLGAISLSTTGRKQRTEKTTQTPRMGGESETLRWQQATHCTALHVCTTRVWRAGESRSGAKQKQMQTGEGGAAVSSDTSQQEGNGFSPQAFQERSFACSPCVWRTHEAG